MIKYYIKRAFIELGIFSVKAQEDNVIKEFINSIKPVKTQFELRRIGNPNGDGGYLLPDDLEDINYCFSPGVSDEASFEEDLTAKGIHCFLADYSVEQPPLKNEYIDFTQKFVGSYNNEKYIEINRWLNENLPDGKGDGILQMDIEGQEYEVIHAIDSNLLKRFRIITIEFHSMDSMFNKFGFNIISHSFRKLLNNFKVVHIHPNNCCGTLVKGDIKIPRVMEFTFLRKDRIETISQATDFPHVLDLKNTDKDDIALPACWYN